LQAIDLLGAARGQQVQEALIELTRRREPASIQSAAIMSLDQTSGSWLSAELILRWANFTPQVRSTALNALLKRPVRCEALLKAIKDGSIRASELNSSQWDFLRNHSDANVAQLAKKISEQMTIGPRQQVIDTMMPAVQLIGDAAKGKTTFLNRCSSCHRVGNEGFALGPDLVTVKNSGKEKLLVNILDPNREVASQYSAYLIETKDGDSLLGIIVNDTAASITLRQAYGTETVVLRNNIKKLKNQGQSLMPEGLEDGLKPQDLADLLEFISN
jgi:putative heme-binding domain-containing protein